MSNGDCEGKAVGRESEMDLVMGHLDAVLETVRADIDRMRNKLIPVMRDMTPEASTIPGEPPLSSASALVLRLREFCERGEKMGVEIRDMLERLEV